MSDAARLVIDARYVTSRPSGIGNYVAQLIARLPELAPDARFRLWTHPERPDVVRSANVTCVPVSAPADGLRTLLDHCRLRSTLAEQNGRLERWIAMRTGGRVHGLRVESLDGRVIVHGCSGSYHVRQLALAAVLEAFEASESEPGDVELDIEVCGGW